MTKVYDISAEQAAQMLDPNGRVSAELVRDWCRRGKIAAQKNRSGRWMLNADDLADVARYAVSVVVDEPEG